MTRVVAFVMAMLTIGAEARAESTDADPVSVWSAPLLRPTIGAAGNGFAFDVAAGATVIVSPNWGERGVYMIPSVGYAMTRGAVGALLIWAFGFCLAVDHELVNVLDSLQQRFHVGIGVDFAGMLTVLTDM